MDHVLALEGRVDGVPGSNVRVTVAGDVVTGMLWVGNRVIAIAPAANGPLAVESDSVALPNMPFEQEPDPTGDAILSDHSTGGCLQLTPSHVANPVKFVTGATELTFDNSFSVDAEFASLYGSGWPAKATAFINAADGFYDTFLDVRIRAIDLHSHAASVFPGTTTSALLADMRSHYGAAHGSLSRENAHLFTGKQLTGAVGQANCIGGAGAPTTAYTTSMAAHCDPVRFSVFTWFPLCLEKILIHELAHILSAHHHYANCAETAQSYDPRVTFDVCTVMINDIGLASMRMSLMNRIVTRGWAESVPL